MSGPGANAFCHVCGQPVGADDAFCLRCGSPLAASAPPVATQATKRRAPIVLIVALALAMTAGAALFILGFVARPYPTLIPGAASPSPAPALKKVKVVASFPLQGALQRFSVGIVNAMRMVFDSADGKAGNAAVALVLVESSSAGATADTALEAENARRAVADASVVAYLGPLTSGAAKVSIPIACPANLAMVSPTAVYPGLTKAGKGEAGEPNRYYPACKRNFARVVPADDVQGTVAARWANALGLRSVFIVHDESPYGGKVSDAFRLEATRLGLRVAGDESVLAGSTSFRPTALRVASSGARLLYYASIDGRSAAALVREAKAAQPSLAFMAPDGVAENEFRATAAAEGAYLTFPMIEPAGYDASAKEWAARYQAKHGQAPNANAIYGYEAARVVLAAIARAGAKADDRAMVRDLVMGTSEFEGFFGRWSFDANGDTTLTAMAGMQVRGGEYRFVREVR